MPKITGGGSHTRRLRRLTSAAAIERIGQALFVAGNTIQVEAQISITDGNKNGRVYTHEFVTINGRAVPIRERPTPHQASAPGEAPADDTSVLANNIETIRAGPLRVEVSSNAPYSKFMEFGTSKIAERPFMRPAAARKRDEVTELLTKAINREIKGS